MDTLHIFASQAAQVPSRLAGNEAAGGAAFAQLLASTAVPPTALETVAPSTPVASQALPALRDLARRLDDIERNRIEATLLPGQIAHAHQSGVGGAAIALAMHRQARVTAAYNLDVLWSARLVGVAGAALKQLVTAT
ncbi:hypothetical protein LJR230_002534 [Trinickia sp. LjRoot230]|uniref:hypothetical protein n=1 Tax=Trinickia sp. LjRoot230 TaxID=3342288 RepID=UPI003ECCDFCF